MLDEGICIKNVLAAQCKTVAACEKEEITLAKKKDRRVEHYDLMIHTLTREMIKSQYNQPTKIDVFSVLKKPEAPKEPHQPIVNLSHN